jgi:hypothetical protein
VSLASLSFELPRRKVVQVPVGAGRQHAARMTSERQIALEHLQKTIRKAPPRPVVNVIAPVVRPTDPTLLNQKERLAGVAEPLQSGSVAVVHSLARPRVVCESKLRK